jgi:hypothetical protein
LKARRSSGIVALALAVAAIGSGTARAEAGPPTAVLVVPASSAVFASPTAAHGLLVVGSGATVSRRAALASLLRGKMQSASIHSGIPGGRPLIRLSNHSSKTTFYVALPPPGKHHNVVRYPIAVVGPGYQGLLTSTSTRLDGLVAIGDVAPSALAIDRGKKPRIRSRPSSNPLGHLRWLDRRLSRAHDARIGAQLVLVGLVTLFGLLALGLRSAALGRVAFLSAPACLVVAVVLSASGVTGAWHVITALALAAGGLALAGGVLLPPRVRFGLGLTAVFAFLFAVMWARPEWNALAAIGPKPDGGGRFYGINNQVETMLLAPALVLCAVVGPTALPIAALLLAAGIAASPIGADGGGLVSYLAGFVLLWLRLRETRPSPGRVAVAFGVAAAAALALVGIDSATGGSSHVTKAVGHGPDSLAGDLGHRIHLSAVAVTANWYSVLLFAASVAALVWLAFRRPRVAVLDAFLLALAVSLLVNDTPVDIAGLGALAGLVLWAWLGRSGERLGPTD